MKFDISGRESYVGNASRTPPAENPMQSWPKIEAIMPEAIAYHRGSSHGTARVEVTCRTCGVQRRHAFPDGSSQSGLRYGINMGSIQGS